jgi:Arc/MetJ-type ribon-helix-helix transcriptional regulator
MKAMPQAKFSLSEAQMDFINRHEAWGFPDKSALVRQALDQMQARLAQERLVESARLYAEVYAEEQNLRDLTEAALEDWPR